MTETPQDPVTDALKDRFFEISIDLFCYLNFSGYFQSLNPAWERTLGFTREELMSTPFIEFVHPDDRERTLAQNKKVRSGEQALAFENRYLCKNGEYRWLLWNAASDFNHELIFSVARDITARKQAEQEKEVLVKELQVALEEVKKLEEFIPICSYCRRVRDDDDYWQSVEAYISQETNSQFSHGICPSCYQTAIEED